MKTNNWILNLPQLVVQADFAGFLPGQLPVLQTLLGWPEKFKEHIFINEVFYEIKFYYKGPKISETVSCRRQHSCFEGQRWFQLLSVQLDQLRQ